MLKVTYCFFRSSRMNLNILQNCSYHSHKFAKNLELISNDLLPSFKGFKPLEIVEKNKPLILLYSWLLAKNKHISKYSKFYLDRGIDVLVVRTNPWDLLRPTKGSQVTANTLSELSLLLMWLLKFNYENATKHYEKASEMFKANLCRAPGLFIFSKSDPVSNMSVNMPVVQAWEEMGIEVFTKCFEKSSHVAHFRLHKSEYEEELILLPTMGRTLQTASQSTQGGILIKGMMSLDI
ncbi:hypothetical protein Anas_05915 [Armadillidium nasatum]|uniref:Transmembrane protein 53 n=1 Tax=Armadillidium nasatum TaxID=96803 RepID=A0A5N5TFG8_9CRUS|nr:hypothetical protein Anas_05915 [Armadillidium nasatum]